MEPLVQLGPLNLSTGGLLLLLAAALGVWLLGRVARARGGPALADAAESCVLPALAGALAGARLWYGLLNWDLYGPQPALFLEPRAAGLAWPGALLGGALAAWLWCRRRGLPTAALADAAALALPPAQALAALGMLLSGEALGVPTDLPWRVNLLGAERHPTQLYYTLAALLAWLLIALLARRRPAPGALAAAYLAAGGLAMVLVEPLRADSLLLPGGVRAAQLAGLAMVALAIGLARPPDHRAEPVPEPAADAPA